MLLRTLWITGAAVGALTASAHGQSAGETMPSNDELYRELKALRAEVAQFRAERDDSQIADRRAAEIKAIVADVLADADTRASLLQSGLTAGHDGSAFFVASADGAFVLKVGGQIQARYMLNSRDGTGVDNWEGGFQLRRVKVNFGGHIGSPRLEYFVQFAANRDSGSVELEDTMIAWRPADDVRLWGGRFQDSFAREQMMSSKRQQAVDRSAAANIFAANDGYVEGFGIEWTALPDSLKLALTVNDGMNSGTPGGSSTGFLGAGNDFQNDATDFALTARADVKLAGDWRQNADVASWSGDEGSALFLGAGLHYEVGETGDSQASATTAATGPYDSFLQWTLDGLYKSGGLGVMAAFYGWHFDATDANAFGDTDHYAATIQAGYMIVPDELEPFIRYEWIEIDDALTADNDLQFITVGLNYYLAAHNAKFTTDIVFALDNINAVNTLGTGLSGIGLLTDDADENDQAVWRAQFQLLF